MHFTVKCVFLSACESVNSDYSEDVIVCQPCQLGKLYIPHVFFFFFFFFFFFLAFLYLFIYLFIMFLLVCLYALLYNIQLILF